MVFEPEGERRQTRYVPGYTRRIGIARLRKCVAFNTEFQAIADAEAYQRGNKEQMFTTMDLFLDSGLYLNSPGSDD